MKINKLLLPAIGLLFLISGCNHASSSAPPKLNTPEIVPCTDDTLATEDWCFSDNHYFKIDTNNEGATAYWCCDGYIPGPSCNAPLKGSGTGVFGVGPFSDFKNGDTYIINVIVVKDGMRSSNIAQFEGQQPPS